MEIECEICGMSFAPFEYKEGDYQLRRVEYSKSSEPIKSRTMALCPMCMKRIKTWVTDNQLIKYEGKRY